MVAYYPEVIASNMKSLSGTPFIHDYVGIHRPHDFPKKMHAISGFGLEVVGYVTGQPE